MDVDAWCMCEAWKWLRHRSVPDYQGTQVSRDLYSATEHLPAPATNSDMLSAAGLQPADGVRAREWEDDTLY